MNKATTTTPRERKGTAECRRPTAAALPERREEKRREGAIKSCPYHPPFSQSQWSSGRCAVQYSAVQGVAGVSRRPLRSPLDEEEEEKRQDEDRRVAASFAERWRPAAPAVRPLRSAAPRLLPSCSCDRGMCRAVSSAVPSLRLVQRAPLFSASSSSWTY